MTITSTAFADNDFIPSKYTCEGINVNPPLTFSQVPVSAQSLVLIVDDPDASEKAWVHWIIFNMPPSTLQILENSVPVNSTLGINNSEKTQYVGPCPPSGKHRYFFKLYALDKKLALSLEPKKEYIEEQMQGHIIEQAEIVGIYQKVPSH